MISRSTGEVKFQDVVIVPHAVLPSALAHKSRGLPIPGWSGCQLGVRRSDLGSFDLEVLTNADERIQLVLLAHVHPFHESTTPGDAERRAFHEGIMNSELAGQREFSWGEVICRLDQRANKDWLVLAYNQGPRVPLVFPEVLLRLHARSRAPSRRLNQIRSEARKTLSLQPMLLDTEPFPREFRVRARCY